MCAYKYNPLSGKLDYYESGAGGGATTALDNLASVAINTTLLPGVTNSIDLGSTTKTFKDIYLTGTSDPFYIKITGTTPTAIRTITFPNNTGTIALTSDLSSYLLLSGGTMAGTLVMDANSITMTGSLAATGARVLKGWFTDAEFTNVPTIGGNALGTIYAVIGQTMYIGTTAVAINRASAALVLTGITSIDGSSASCTGNAATVTTNANLTGIVTSIGNATAIADGAISYAKLANGTAGNLITWSATGAAAVVATGNATQVLTSNGAGAAPTFQAAAGGGLVWGAAVSGTTTGGTTWTLSNSSNASAIGISVIAGNTQANIICLTDLEIGTSGNTMGLLIKGTGGVTGGAVGTGVNHLTLWGNTNNNENKVISIGSETSYTERAFWLATGTINITPNAAFPCLDFNPTLHTRNIIDISGTWAVTQADYYGIYYSVFWSGAITARSINVHEILQNRTNTATSGTIADDFDVWRLRYRPSQNGAGGTLTSAGSLLKLELAELQSAGTLTSTMYALEISSQTRSATRTWCTSITHNNSDAGGLACGIDMSSFSVDEPLFKVVADAITVLGAISGQIAIDVAGTTYYIPYMAHGT